MRWLSAARRLRSRRQFDHCRISSLSHTRTSRRWCSKARTSGTVICASFFPQPLLLQHQERQRQHGQSRVVMPSHPAPCRILVQPASSLGRLNVFLDRPPRPSHGRQLLQHHLGCRIGAMILQLRLLADGPPHQQPQRGAKPSRKRSNSGFNASRCCSSLSGLQEGRTRRRRLLLYQSRPSRRRSSRPAL